MQFNKPKKDSEANIQADFKKAVEAVGLFCWLEYRIKGRPGQRGCRFDAVVHDGEKIIAIVEVKNPSKPEKYDWTKTKQHARYASYGVPVILIKERGFIPFAVAELRGYGG